MAAPAERRAVLGPGSQVVALERRIEVHRQICGAAALETAAVAGEHGSADLLPALRGATVTPSLPVPLGVVDPGEGDLVLGAPVQLWARLLVQPTTARLRADVQDRAHEASRRTESVTRAASGFCSPAPMMSSLTGISCNGESVARKKMSLLTCPGKVTLPFQ